MVLSYHRWLIRSRCSSIVQTLAVLSILYRYSTQRYILDLAIFSQRFCLQMMFHSRLMWNQLMIQRKSPFWPHSETCKYFTSRKLSKLVQKNLQALAWIHRRALGYVQTAFNSRQLSSDSCGWSKRRSNACRDPCDLDRTAGQGALSRIVEYFLLKADI